jgi:lipase chaperone LimK
MMKRLSRTKTGVLVVVGLMCLGALFLRLNPETVSRWVDGQEPMPFAHSLQGTQPDGGLQIFGNIPSVGTVNSAELPNDALKRFFDYYLSTLGEADEAAVLSKIRQEIDKSMSATHARAARELLGRYVAYKKALDKLAQELGRDGQATEASVVSIRKRFEGMRKLRAEFFDAREYNDMFGAEEAYDSLALSQLEITQNAQLTQAQKAERLKALQESMPADLKNELEAPYKVVHLQNQVDQLREKGGSEDDIYRLRAHALTPEAAARLGDVDREEAAWKGRISQYLVARQRILQSNDSAAQQQEALQQLQLQQFSAQERPRLTAYEGQY